MVISTHGARAGSGRRWRARSGLVAVLSVLALALAPGWASAAPTGTVKPVVNCYTDNGNGTYTAVLGYTNSNSTVQDIPVGSENSTNPTSWQSKVPTSFKTGTHNGVFSVTLTQAQAYGQSPASWKLNGTTLNVSNVGNVPVCSSSQLPMLANGAAVLAAFVAAGIFGVVVLRRSQRRAAAAAASA